MLRALAAGRGPVVRGPARGERGTLEALAGIRTDTGDKVDQATAVAVVGVGVAVAAAIDHDHVVAAWKLRENCLFRKTIQNYPFLLLSNLKLSK